MGLHLGMGLSGSQVGVRDMPIQDTAPSVDDTTAKINDGVVNFTSGTYSALGGGSVAITTSEMRVDGNAVSNPYTLLDADDGLVFSIYEVATETGGANPGTRITNTANGTITHVAPTIISPIPDATFFQGLGPQVIDASSHWTGRGMTWSVDIDDLVARTSGDIEVLSDDIVAQVATPVTHHGYNSGLPSGLDNTFNLTIEETTLVITGLLGDGTADSTLPASIGANITNGENIDGYAWGTSLNGTELGTGTSPSSLPVGTIYLKALDGVLEYRQIFTSVAIHKFTSASTYDDTAYEVGETVTISYGASSGVGSTTRTLRVLTLDGVDKLSEATIGASSATWGTTGETGDVIISAIVESDDRTTKLDDTAITVTLNSVPVEVSPIINSFTIGTQAGNDLPATIDLEEGQPTPYTVWIVGVADGEAAPDSDQVKAGTDGDDIVATYSNNFDISADGDVTIDVGPNVAGTFDWYATVEDDDGHLWDSVISDLDKVLSFTTFAFAKIGNVQGIISSGTTKSWTIDCTGYDTGDELLFIGGCRGRYTSLTVTEDGESAAAGTRIVVDSSPLPTGITHVDAWKFVLTETGTSGMTVDTIEDASVADHMLQTFGVKGGTIPTETSSAVNNQYATAGATCTSSVTPANASSYIFAATMNSSTYIGTPGFSNLTWVGVTETEIQSPAAHTRVFVYAGADSTSTSEVTVSMDSSNGGSGGLITIAIDKD